MNLPERPSLPLPRWLGPLAVACAVLLVPWMVFLGLTLPSKRSAAHYDVAWIGFDAAMCLVLAALAYCAQRRLPATGPVAAVAATMLVVDAWFDVVTASTRDEFAGSLLMALLAELPLATICAWTAINAEQVRTRRYRRIREWLQAPGSVNDRPDPPPPR